MQSMEEKYKVVLQAYYAGFWPADCFAPFNSENGREARDPDGYRNFELLKKEVNTLDPEEDFAVEDARKLFLRLRDLGNILKQTLIRKPTTFVQVSSAPQTIDPAQNLPHDDIPELRTIRNLTDAIRVRNLPKEKIMRFQYLRPGSPSFREFNERIQFIVDHQIGDGDPPTVLESKTVSSTSSPTSLNEPGTKNPIVNRALNDVLTTIERYQGRSHAQTAKRREVLAEIYNRFVSRVKTIADAEKLGRTIDAQMDEWDSSSIR